MKNVVGTICAAVNRTVNTYGMRPDQAVDLLNALAQEAGLNGMSKRGTEALRGLAAHYKRLSMNGNTVSRAGFCVEAATERLESPVSR